ncbi:glutamate--cysteine ligase [Saxibacter everestensis]|uniref:Putative glutamate--cysteine ligase 2 n=1 Tax=Saxibacter everestensis TaxID=2909229 RepID=A0ABY8QX04_9MICO|nr:glutamate--cysteine ligase [Brevibacteriaceae bacterium ZFBP1038]
MPIEFQPSKRSTLGVEWELALVSASDGELMSVAEEILRAVKPDDADEHPKIKQELLLNTVEIITGICSSVADAKTDLEGSLAELRTVTDPLGVEVMSAGTHPFAQWAQQKVTDKERYAELINRTQWWGRQMLIYGVHVHVGIDSRDKVLPIVNAMLAYFPHFQCLSASSPYWGGEDTAYASNRALIFQQLPTAGLPFQFESWEQFEHYVNDMLVTGVIDQFNEVRWDIRPSPALGTIEVRVCDGVPTMSEITAIAALTQCLIDDFSQRLDDGETLPTMPPWFVQENKWRAARYGMDAIIILNDKGDERLVTEDLAELLPRLAPVAERLGCSEELASINTIIDRGASYQRQHAVAKAHDGDLRQVVRSLVAEMRAGVPQQVR